MFPIGIVLDNDVHLTPTLGLIIFNKTHTILHVSDSQILGRDGDWNGFPVNAEAQLKATVDTILGSERFADAIIFTGDLADKGEIDAYRKIVEITDPLKSITDNIVWVMGNHDERTNFGSFLGVPSRVDGSVDYVVDVNGLNVVVLDTTVPGKHYGVVDEGQLVWLEEQLGSPGVHGSLIAMHHPPVPVVMPLAVTVELKDQGGFERVVGGADRVRSIIAGHMHYSTFSMFAGVPVSVASSTCYTQDLGTLVGGTRGRNTGQSYNLVEVFEETVSHSVVPVGASELVGKYVSPEEVKNILLREKQKPFC